VRFARRLSSFSRLSAAAKAAAVLAWVLLTLAAIGLRLMPIRRFGPLLGRPIGAVACMPLATPRQEKRARAIRRAILRAASVAPLRADCLPQALAAVAFSRLLGIPTTTHLGVKFDVSRAMEAHAWLCTGRVCVTGGNAFGAFVPVACFATLSR
jgi:hypothetical protein